MTKLNLRTPPQEMVETVANESKIVKKRFVARMGGKKKYRELRKRFCYTASRMQQSYTHDVMMFTLPSGNKWCAFEHTMYDAGFAYSRCYRFCYYMTVPYGGIYCYVQELEENEEGEQHPEDRCIVFGSHFFERLHERDIYIWDGITTFIEFFIYNNACDVHCTDRDHNKWDVRIYSPDTKKSAIGRGFRSPDGKVLYVKTVLADEQLTTRQRRDTSRHRGAADARHGLYDYNPQVMYNKIVARYLSAVKEGKVEEFFDDMQRRYDRMEESDKDYIDNSRSHT